MQPNSREKKARSNVLGRALLVANLAICFAPLSACSGKTDQGMPLSEVVKSIEGEGGEAVQSQSQPVAIKTFDEVVDEAHCLSCHTPKNKVGAPTWKAVARKYRKDKAAAVEAHLTAKITHGGSGVWGRVNMPPYPELNESDMKVAVQGIMVAGEAAPASRRSHAGNAKPQVRQEETSHR